MPDLRKHRRICAIALGLSLSGCAMDFGWLPKPREEAPPEASEFSLEPTADLPAPEGLRATSGELRMVPLKWEPLLMGDIGGYVVERAPARDGHFEQLARVSEPLTTTYLDRETVPETPPVSAAPDAEAIFDESDPRHDGLTWFYRVRAYSADGTLGSRTSSLAVATTAPPPGSPEDLRAYSRQPRAVPLSWRASEDSDVVGYRVERSPTASGPFELLAEIDGRHQTIYVDRGLGDLRVFYYRIVAVNAEGGLGDASDPVRAVTKPEPLPPIGLRTVDQRLGANAAGVGSQRRGRHRRISAVPDLRGRRLSYAQIARLERRGHHQLTDAAVEAGQRVSYTLVAIDRDGLESATRQSHRGRE